MNECEQLHPLLRGYLEDRLSARDRRLVARHLNLCASARKELDRLRGGGPKSPLVSANPPTESWDLKFLRLLFKTPPPVPRPETGAPAKKARSSKPATGPILEPKPSSASALKSIFGILLFFVVLAFVTHLVQNAGDNTFFKNVKRWLSKNHALGVSPSLDMVLDLTSQVHWSGDAAPVARPYHEFITDPMQFKLFWAFLQPGVEPPPVDFSKNAVVLVLVGPKPTAGYAAKFKRMENYADKTVLWYDETTPLGSETAMAGVTRPWVLQVVPKPAQLPVLIQKIQ